MMDQKIIDKVFSKSATPDEARDVAILLATDDGLQYCAQRYDREAYLLNEELLEDWLDHDIPTKNMKIRFMSQLNLRIRTFRFRVAAAVFIPFLLLTGAFTYLTTRIGVFQSKDMAEFVVPFGEQLNVVLQDGTQVQLNSGSRLMYPKSFGLFNRRVRLTGEAYFSVSRELNRPFEVDLNEIKIKVTGTQFNVKAYPDDKSILVFLEEGSINIADKSNTIYPMKVGESAEYVKASGACRIAEVADKTQHTAWRTKSLNFYRVPLKDILKTLERQYEVQFDVSDTLLLDYRFSLSTMKTDLDEVLTDLQKVSNVRFKLDANNRYSIESMN